MALAVAISGNIAVGHGEGYGVGAVVSVVVRGILSAPMSCTVTEIPVPAIWFHSSSCFISECGIIAQAHGVKLKVSDEGSFHNDLWGSITLCSSVAAGSISSCTISSSTGFPAEDEISNFHNIPACPIKAVNINLLRCLRI